MVAYGGAPINQQVCSFFFIIWLFPVFQFGAVPQCGEIIIALVLFVFLFFSVYSLVNESITFNQV